MSETQILYVNLEMLCSYLTTVAKNQNNDFLFLMVMCDFCNTDVKAVEK